MTSQEPKLSTSNDPEEILRPPAPRGSVEVLELDCWPREKPKKLVTVEALSATKLSTKPPRSAPIAWEVVNEMKKDLEDKNTTGMTDMPHLCSYTSWELQHFYIYFGNLLEIQLRDERRKDPALAVSASNVPGLQESSTSLAQPGGRSKFTESW